MENCNGRIVYNINELDLSNGEIEVKYCIIKEDYFIDDFECSGDEVLVESSPPSPRQMAARLAPAQSGAGADASPGGVRELLVIPEEDMQLQHAIQQVSSTVVEMNGDSSGHSSPAAETQHTYITVATGDWKPDASTAMVKTEYSSGDENESNGVNYHVQYVDSQELYTPGPQGHMETLRTYPLYGVATVEGAAAGETEWPDGDAEYARYGVVVNAQEQPTSPAAPPAATRMPPATVQWLLDHYETADGVSLPRSSLYAHYIRHCSARNLDPVNAASFGKVIRSVFVGLRTRRLGTRGNSKYHYYGIRAKHGDVDDIPPAADDDDKDEASPQSQARDREREPGPEPAQIGSSAAHRQYLGAVSPPDPPPVLLPAPDEDAPPAALDALRRHHRDQGADFLEAVAALDTGLVERNRRAFWRRAPPELCRRTLARLLAVPAVLGWLQRAELALHQRAVELLLPDVLRPIPPHLTQAIRNFAKTLEGALAVAPASGAPEAGARAQRAAAGALAAALRRYTSLNHLAQAARAVLTNQHQIQQMLSDLNRVDFRVVREQAAWACACGASAAVRRLEADFKTTLGLGATLEQWAHWLEQCVASALAPHHRRPDYAARARRLLLDWSFYSSLVIRELTLRSAASFGSFHLIRLLYDEYVAYLIERRVAAHEGSAPIAVMHRPQPDGGDDAPDDPSHDLSHDLSHDMSHDASRDADDDPDWEWDDDDDDVEDDEPDCKRPKLV